MSNTYTFTSYLPGNGASWLFDDNKRTGFLSPIIINKLSQVPKIGDVFIIENDIKGVTKKVFINGEIVFEKICE